MKNKPENIKLDEYSMLGNHFLKVAQQAKDLAVEARNKELNFAIPTQNVEFEFNGVICVVSHKTDCDLIWRDYQNALECRWKTVGPDCVVEYPAETLKEIADKKEANHVMRLELEEKWRKEEQEKREAFLAKVKGVEFACKDPEYFANQKEINKDPYGARVVSYAEDWAKLMQAEMATGKPLEEIAQAASHEADYDGITGFMYGAAVSVLAKCWEHGEALRKWHNKEYGQEDSEGTVNPALMTISVEKEGGDE